MERRGKLRITNYELRNGEFGEATERWSDRVIGVFASLREGEREKGRKGEWVILKLRITNCELRNVNLKIS